MAIELKNGVSYCIIDQTAIFLDVFEDRYSAAPARLLETPRSCWPLLEKRLLVGSGKIGLSVRPASVPRPAGTFETEDIHTSIFSGLRSVWVMFSTMRQLEHHGLGRVIYSRPNTTPAARNLVEVARYLGSFRLIDRFFDQNRVCLPRSLAIKSRLRRAGLSADLIIGVKLHPFLAHAWLQDGDIVLNDTLDRVEHFTPIARL